jgi:hypothetical protein
MSKELKFNLAPKLYVQKAKLFKSEFHVSLHEIQKTNFGRKMKETFPTFLQTLM